MRGPSCVAAAAVFVAGVSAEWDLGMALHEHKIHKTLVDAAETAEKMGGKPVHIVFSTGCNAYQHWQSEVLKSSAWRVGQRGPMTQIVVGCDVDRMAQAEVLSMDARTSAEGDADRIVTKAQWEKSANPKVKVHYAPAVKESAKFPWFNKPWSFYHWVQETELTDDVYVIMDPDEFFLHTLDGGGNKELSKLTVNTRDELVKLIANPLFPDIVKPGTAVAQTYGLGAGWVSPRMFDREKICGKDSYCSKVTADEANNYYSVGPPYMIHRQDFKKVMQSYWEFMRPTYAQDKGDIQADMYAYNMAAAHHNLKHIQIGNYMVSNEEAGYGEGWDKVDKIKSMFCQDPYNSLTAEERDNLPTVLHAAAHYQACSGGEEALNIRQDAKCPGENSELWNFHKGHVPTQILGCKQRLLVPPPDDFFNVQRTVKGKRRAFMICMLTSLVNNAVIDYKTENCAKGFNTKKCIRIDMHGYGKGTKENPEDAGFSLARVLYGTEECP